MYLKLNVIQIHLMTPGTHYTQKLTAYYGISSDICNFGV